MPMPLPARIVAKPDRSRGTTALMATLLAVTALTLVPRVHAQGGPGGSDLPDRSAYVVVGPDGRLRVDGQRVRYWGVIGGFPNFPNLTDDMTPAQRQAAIDLAYREVDLFIDRFEDLGFNLVRKFHGHPHGSDYTRGDGSPADVMDYFYHRLHERGFRVWNSGFNSTGVARPEDVDIIDDPRTASAWREAVADSTGRDGYRPVEGSVSIRKNPAVVWDERLEAIALQRMTNTANHFNQHSGLRWADDPVFAVWELSNEEWWIARMLGGSWVNQPEFFKRGLIEKWHAFLRDKYGSEEALVEAWLGLLPGESLDEGTLLFAPMARPQDPSLLNDANPLFRRDSDSPAPPITRDDVNGTRASDVLEFLTDLIIGHKQRLAAGLKPLGRSLTLSPMIFDTGRGEGIQMQYMHQMADAVSHDAYINGHALYPGDDRAPWDSGLDEYPRINEGVPWLEHNRPPNMPFLGYETQIMQPAKYRAEFPMRIASLASIQDWDAICWHYWGPVRDIGTDENPFDRAMDITTGGHPQGYHYTFDAVQNAVMRASAFAWRHTHLKPAPEPTTFIFGRRSLYDPTSFEYGRAYQHKLPDFTTTTYQHGMRLLIDPSREDDEVIGPVVRYNNRSLPSPAAPTDEIAYHWRHGSLLWDAPGVVGYGGFLAQWGDEVRFKQGLTLSDVRFDNPPQVAFPVTEDERYVVFVLTSTTEQPLNQTPQATLAIKSTSFNDGFELGWGRGQRNERGNTPVREVRVAARVRAPWLAGMSYSFRDWHDREIGSGTVGSDGVLDVPSDIPLWVINLSR